jgi:hypothetical protein
VPPAPRSPAPRRSRSSRRPVPSPTAAPRAGLEPATLHFQAAAGSGLPATISVVRGSTSTKWTQAQIAQQSGLSGSVVSLLLRGDRVGYYQTLKAIALTLDVTLDELSAFLATRRANRKRRAMRARQASATR